MTNKETTFTATFDIYSPRWGHTDPYTIHIEGSELSINNNTIKQAKCVITEENEYSWSGHRSNSGNPILNIMSDDQIYAPEIIPELLEWALSQWMKGNVNKETLKDGLDELFRWIDNNSRKNPSSKLWEGYLY